MPVMLVMGVALFFVIPEWLGAGLPFWPLVMGISAVLTLWGALVGSWRAPFAVFCGYLGMRGVMWGLDPSVREVAAFLVWALVAIQLYRVKAWVPCVAYLCSGVVYPALLLFGFQIVYMGLAPIIAELFALAALISMGGGLYERTLSNGAPDRHRRRFGAILGSVSLGVAKGA